MLRSGKILINEGIKGITPPVQIGINEIAYGDASGLIGSSPLFRLWNSGLSVFNVQRDLFRIISSCPPGQNVLELFDVNYGMGFAIEGVYGRAKFGTGYVSAPATLNITDYGTVQRYINFERDGANGYIQRASTGLYFDGMDINDGLQFRINSDLSFNPLLSAYFKRFVGINTVTPSAYLDVFSKVGYDQLRLQTPFTPASSSDPSGNVGNLSWDEDYFYVKTNSGWKRTGLVAF